MSPRRSVLSTTLRSATKRGTHSPTWPSPRLPAPIDHVRRAGERPTRRAQQPTAPAASGAQEPGGAGAGADRAPPGGQVPDGSVGRGAEAGGEVCRCCHRVGALREGADDNSPPRARGQNLVKIAQADPADAKPGPP